MSRGVTLVGYAVVAVAMLAVQLGGLVARRTVTLGQALQPLKRRGLGRVVLLAGWLWLGWHLFVRGQWR